MKCISILPLLCSSKYFRISVLNCWSMRTRIYSDLSCMTELVQFGDQKVKPVLRKTLLLFEIASLDH
jgi:hypothetical protein